MKKLAFVLTGAAALTLAACNNNQDTVNNAELNQPTGDDLNQLSTDAANDAANGEAAALGDQQNQLQQENAATDNASNPSDDQEQNVSGM
jgi:predicted component of type VI protein secretion system